MKITTDILIIGAGPVGLFAAYNAGFLGMKATIVDYKENIGGQLTYLYPEKYIYDIPAFPKIKAKDLIALLEQQIKPFNINKIMNTEVAKLTKLADDTFELTTNKNHQIITKAIIIASGGGAFKHNKPPINNIEEFEANSIDYMVSKKEKYTNKTVLIAGGGDSAVDWAIELQDIAKKIILIHRRNNFRCSPHSLNMLKKLQTENKVNILTPYVLNSLKGTNNTLQEIEIKNFQTNEKKSIKADNLLAFFGLTRDLGAIKTWGLNINMGGIMVNPTTYETNIKGIFAIGDIANYENKLKLINVGFAESSIALTQSWKYVFPNKVYHFSHSTDK